MEAVLDILVFFAIVSLLWIIALEVRFHSLKNIAAESQQMAQDAVDAAEAMIARVEAHLKAEKSAKPKRR